jgi:general secretion pathway protein A
LYKNYFGLKTEPFSIAPDPAFLYQSARHQEALAHLLYGIKAENGFVLLTGEVGTGKTTVCRALLHQLPANVEIAFILQPRLSAVELLETICDELEIDYPAGNDRVKVFIDRLNSFLLKTHSQGKRTVLIIDEAQNLSIEVLEQVRLLTNLETDKYKLLRIIMLGQPEFKELLGRPELRQLSQRVTARYHLEPLDASELSAYVDHRLAVAGVERPIFTARAIRKLYRYSGGIPRVVNLLCDRSLLGAYVQGTNTVTPELVKQAAEEIFSRKASGPTTFNALVQVLVILVLVLIVIGLGGLLVGLWLPELL